MRLFRKYCSVTAKGGRGGGLKIFRIHLSCIVLISYNGLIESNNEIHAFL